MLPVLGALWLFVAAARMPIMTPDVWWHLATGRWIAAQHAIPHQDPFSYTLAGRSWTAHEWLADVLLDAVQRTGGLLGLVFWRAALLVAAFGVAWAAARLHATRLVSLLLLAAAAYASQRNWLDRPQLWSFVLTPLVLLILERDRERGGRVLWTLPPLFLLWVNLHGGFFLGLGLLFAWLLASAPAARRAGSERWRHHVRKLLPAGIAALATCINPNGVRGVLYPLAYESAAWRATIREERPGWLDSPYAWVHFGLLLGLLLALVARRRQVPAPHAVVALLLAWVSMPRLGGLALPLAAERNAPLFLLVATPILAWHCSAWVGARWGGLENRVARALQGRVAWGASSVIGALALLASVLALPRDGAPEARLLPGRFPTAATRWLQVRRLPGHLVNPYRWGGYLAFHLWPEYKTWIDSRGDLYGTERLREDDLLYHMPPGSEPAVHALLQRYDANVIVWFFLSIDSGRLQLHPFTRWLLQQPDWRLVFVDWADPAHPRAPAGTTAIFVRQDARNEALLRRLPPVQLPSELPR